MYEKGFVKARVGGITNARGGRRKKFYTLTSYGVKTLKEIYEMRTEMARAIPKLALS